MSLCIGTAHSIWLSADLVCPHWCRAQTCSKTGPLLQTGDAKQSFKIKAFDKDHQTLLNWSFQPTEKESQKQDVKRSLTRFPKIHGKNPREFTAALCFCRFGCFSGLCAAGKPTVSPRNGGEVVPKAEGL